MAAALDLLPELKAGLIGNTTLNRVVGLAAQKDPQAAMTFVDQLPENLKRSASMSAAYEWAKSDATAALEWCHSAGVDVGRSLRLNEDGATDGSVLTAGMLKQPYETLAWVTALPAGPERDRLLEMSLRDGLEYGGKELLARDDGAFLMGLYQKLPPEAQERSAWRIGSSMAVANQVSDLSIIANMFESGAAQTGAISGVFESLSFHNKPKAESLLATLNSGPNLDAALIGMVSALARQSSLPSAAEKAMMISDPLAQRRALDTVVTDWLQRDPAAGRKWLDQASELPAEWIRKWVNGTTEVR
jgi:hypothetical protein